MATNKVSEADLGKEYIDDHSDTVFAWGAFYRNAGGSWGETDTHVIESEIWDVIEANEAKGFCKASTYLLRNVLKYVKARIALGDDDAEDLMGINPNAGLRSASATQSEMGRAYVAAHKDTMYTRGNWYRYQHGVWDEIYEEHVYNELWSLAEHYEQIGQVRPTHNMIRGVANYVGSHIFVPEDKVDAHPDLINLQNGSYDMRQQMLLPHEASDYLTTQLPFSYDPSAKCPIWEYFLQSSLTKKMPDDKAHDPDLAIFLQEAMGYSLTTDISHHVSFWCYGAGANGKGVLFFVLESLAGSSAVPLNVNLLKRDRYQLADIAGKRIALCSEATSFDNVVEDGDVKALIAGDKMNVRQIRERPFVLQPQCKLWWSMNKLPVVADTSEGFWRRVCVIPFNRTFAKYEQIRDLKDQLQQELPGIFNWCMEGLQRLMVNGSFTIPKQVKEQTSTYQKDSNIVALFIEDACITEDGKRVMSSEIYSAYSSWCKLNGYRPYNVRNFKREMETLGFWAKRHSAGVFFYGVKLPVQVSRDTDDADADQGIIF